ncbi:OLC1v1009572C1 [Oldenlandia corymbosa var. corymbosa]|uniref:OLC1v1009572C1 n=1 Tax=Oldenlandia corymbosa var. corymbosa TaxID=529605 RepID=A0AAV1DPS8_OLDCO|nr:OLC1v1009572C1 [Oldenlandia corymbosa var. corymbosa]
MVLDVNYYNGKFYAIGPSGKLWIYDHNSPTPELKVSRPDYRHCVHRYLVESSSSTGRHLMVIHREVADNRTAGFKVYRLNVEDYKCEEIFGLGGDSIFFFGGRCCILPRKGKRKDVGSRVIVYILRAMLELELEAGMILGFMIL